MYPNGSICAHWLSRFSGTNLPHQNIIKIMPIGYGLGIVHYFTSYSKLCQIMEAKMPVQALRGSLVGTFWNAVLVVAGALNSAVNSSTCVLNICSELMF